MKKYILLPGLILFALFAQAADGYKIRVKAFGVKDSMCYLAYYFGDKQYIKDSAQANSKSEIVFSGKEKLPAGIYLVVLPGRKYFEIICDEDQDFSWEVDFNNLDDFSKMKSSGSTDNQMFLEYSKFVNEKGKASSDFKTEQAKAKAENDTVKANAFRDRILIIDKEVDDYKKKLISDHPKTFLTMVFKAMEEPEIPEVPILENGRPDSTFRYRYYRDHFWDNVDFTDDRIVRTPIYFNKLKTYISQLTIQIPDSINKAADFIIEKARGSKDLFKFTVWYITITYETSTIMGMDAVFVHMADKYYRSGDAFWIDEATLFKITDKATISKPLLLGKVAPNLIMKDHEGKLKSLHEVKAKFVALVFWDPDCGHCKKQVPVIDSVYKIYRSKGFEVFAVCAEREYDKWKKYIMENNLEWIHVSDSTLYFKRTYDINSTPIIYLLDKDKKIIAKKINGEQLGEILMRRYKEDLIVHD